MRKQLLLLLTAVLLSMQLMAQSKEAPNSIAVRSIFQNYQWPLESVSSLNTNDFAGGLEFEYYRYLNDFLDLSFPLRINKAHLPLDEQGNTRQTGNLSLDALLNLNLVKNGGFKPHLFAGVSGVLEDMEDVAIAIPLGLGFNIRIAENTHLTTTGAYRLGTDDFRNHLQLGAGLRLALDASGDKPKPKKKDDMDEDGIVDAEDLCPTEAGSVALNGCPDRDLDGVADGSDDCPDVAGIPILNGCPDSDSDGLMDKDDECPTEAGPAANNGCPIRDRDGDGVNDEDDKCPDEIGLASNNGCPINDRDNDGVADEEDDCPNQAGTAENGGCPDTDNDGIVDRLDACPELAGPAERKGCPEVAKTDRETLQEALSAVKFETGSNRLTQNSYAILDQIVSVMEKYRGYKLRISGHTDSVGSREPNRELSEKRAKACYDYLVSKGVNPNRMSYIGLGESQPIADNRYKDGREKNRRVEFDMYIE